MRHSLLLAVLLLGTTWTVAQTQTSPSDQTTQTQPSQTQPSQTQPSTNDQTGATPGDMSPTSDAANKSVEGCVSGSDGNYTLTDKSGTSYQLTGDTSKLAEHVGHEVRITGSMPSASSASGGMAGDSTEGKHTLQVSSVKHISKTCTNNGGMSH